MASKEIIEEILAFANDFDANDGSPLFDPQILQTLIRAFVSDKNFIISAKIYLIGCMVNHEQ